MQIIEELQDHIEEELCDAQTYAELALEYKADHPTMAQLYNELAKEEMEHMAKLHKQVVTIINEYRTKNGEPPADMMAVYNYVHKKNIEKSKDVKILIEMFKE